MTKTTIALLIVLVSVGICNDSDTLTVFLQTYRDIANMSWDYFNTVKRHGEEPDTSYLDSEMTKIVKTYGWDYDEFIEFFELHRDDLSVALCCVVADNHTIVCSDCYLLWKSVHPCDTLPYCEYIFIGDDEPVGNGGKHDTGNDGE